MASVQDAASPAGEIHEERSPGAVTGKPALLWRVFSNVKLGVSWLILLALLSIIGTIIPQKTGAFDQLQNYIRRIGPEKAELFDRLGLFSVYSSWWFALVEVLMLTSIVVASLDRWPRIRREFSEDEPVPPARRYRSAPHRASWAMTGANAQLEKFTDLFRRHFGRPRVFHVGENEVVLSTNRGRWTRVGVYFVHVGILTVALGMSVKTFVGFKGGQMLLSEGTTDNGFLLVHGVDPRGELQLEPRELPFAIRCDDFHIEFYEDRKTGAPTNKPSMFRSTLTIIDDGREVLTRDIVVNDPLRYGGYTFYQASYQEGDLIMRLDAVNKKTGERIPMIAELGKPFKLAGGKFTYAVIGYEQNFTTPETGSLGPAAGIQIVNDEGAPVLNEAGEPMRFAVFKQFPDFDDRREEAVYRLELAKLEKPFMTGLQITNDPGTPVVWAGSGLMIVGMVLAFFLSHRKSWLRLTPEGASFAGTVYKHADGYRSKVQAFAADVQRELPVKWLDGSRSAEQTDENSSSEE